MEGEASREIILCYESLLTEFHWFHINQSLSFKTTSAHLKVRALPAFVEISLGAQNCISQPSGGTLLHKNNPWAVWACGERAGGDWQNLVLCIQVRFPGIKCECASICYQGKLPSLSGSLHISRNGWFFLLGSFRWFTRIWLPLVWALPGTQGEPLATFVWSFHPMEGSESHPRINRNDKGWGDGSGYKIRRRK